VSKKHIGRIISPLGLAIRKFRAKRRLSQEKLAALSGVSRSAIAKIVTGESQTMLAESMKKLAPVLGVSLGELMDMKQEPDSSRALSDYLRSPWAALDKPTEVLKARLLEKLPKVSAKNAPPIDPKAVHELLEVLKRWPLL